MLACDIMGQLTNDFAWHCVLWRVVSASSRRRKIKNGLCLCCNTRHHGCICWPPAGSQASLQLCQCTCANDTSHWSLSSTKYHKRLPLVTLHRVRLQCNTSPTQSSMLQGHTNSLCPQAPTPCAAHNSSGGKYNFRDCYASLSTALCATTRSQHPQQHSELADLRNKTLHATHPRTLSTII